MEEIRKLQEQIDSHPGVAARRRWGRLARMYRVYRRNRQDLEDLLRAPQTNEDLAVELIQNGRPPAVRENYTDDLVRSFLNYVAGMFTMVDHVRRLLKRYEELSLRGNVDARRHEVTSRPEHAIVQGLRNYILHVDIPPFAWRLEVGSPGEQHLFTHWLSTADLLRWDEWTEVARTALQGKDEIDLLALVVDHGTAVDELHEWLLSQFDVVHGGDIAAANALISTFHAALEELDASRSMQPRSQRGSSREDPVSTRGVSDSPQGETASPS